MKKLFSFMLMATALLISGQMKADVVTATTYAELKSQIEGATGERTINVETDLTGDQSITIENGQVITLNLMKTQEENDATITFNAEAIFLKLLHGTLNLTGEGTITSTCSTAGWKPLIQIKGSDVPSAVDYSVLNVGEGISLTCNTCAINVTYYTTSTKCSYGVKVNVAGYVYGTGNAISVNGTIQVTTGNVPEFYISGTLACSEENVYVDSWSEDLDPNAIYAAGYAKWYITGTVMGALPIYVKGGAVTLDGATITATGEYKAPELNNNGSSGCGSAIVYDSNAGYTDHMSITIIGDTKVSSEDGYAIQECVTKGADKMTAQDFVIVSGTFTGGTQGCITMTGTLSEDVKTEGTVSGGTYTGVTNTEEEIKQFLAVAPDGNKIITPVEVGGTIVYVVADKPTDKDWVSTIAAAGATDYVKIAANEEVAADKVIAYLNIPGANKVTVKTGAKLSVGEAVLGADAVIEVEAGGKLIVNGTNGLIAFEPENLVLKADASGYGKFVLNPDVKANKTPYATVEYYAANARAMSKGYRWDIFVCPFVSVDYLMGNMTAEDILEGKTLGSAYQYWNGTQWVSCSTKQQLLDNAGAFMPIAITNTCKKGHHCTYTMKGQLQGNISGVFNVERGFNYFGNGFMADMSAQDMMTAIAAQSEKVESVIYIWNAQDQRFQDFQSNNISSMPDLKGTDFFILKATANDAVDLDYKTLVWDKNK